MKLNKTYMKHHRLVAHLALGPNIEAERTIVVLLGLIIPFEGANADLEGNELIDCSPELLVLLLCGVILTCFLFHARGAARELRINRNKIGLLNALQNEWQLLREIVYANLHTFI